MSVDAALDQIRRTAKIIAQRELEYASDDDLIQAAKDSLMIARETQDLPEQSKQIGRAEAAKEILERRMARRQEMAKAVMKWNRECGFVNKSRSLRKYSKKLRKSKAILSRTVRSPVLRNRMTLFDSAVQSLLFLVKRKSVCL